MIDEHSKNHSKRPFLKEAVSFVGKKLNDGIIQKEEDISIDIHVPRF